MEKDWPPSIVLHLERLNENNSISSKGSKNLYFSNLILKKRLNPRVLFKVLD
jgi:hypothetical protein